MMRRPPRSPLFPYARLFRSGRRTFVSTNAGYRLELHPPRDWIDDLLEHRDRLLLSELHLRADDPDAKADALAEVLDCERIDRKSTRLNSSHSQISYAVFCLE